MRPRAAREPRLGGNAARGVGPGAPKGAARSLPAGRTSVGEGRLHLRPARGASFLLIVKVSIG